MLTETIINLFDSHDYYSEEYNSEDARDDFDSLIESLGERFPTSEIKITGSLGLWDGRHEIEPVVVSSFEEALRRCWGSCDDLVVEEDSTNGRLLVSAFHHDGRNNFILTW